MISDTLFDMKIFLTLLISLQFLTGCNFKQNKIYQCSGELINIFSSSTVNSEFKDCVIMSSFIDTKMCDLSPIKKTYPVNFTFIISQDKTIKFSSESNIQVMNDKNFKFDSEDEIEMKYKSEEKKVDRLNTINKSYIYSDDSNLLFNKITNKFIFSDYFTTYEKFDKDYGIDLNHFTVVRKDFINGTCEKK